MRSARTAAVTLLCIALLIPAGSANAAPERQVLLFLVPGMTYERAVHDPVLTALASHGGIALMTTGGRDGTDAYVTLGAGRLADGVKPGALGSALGAAGRRVGYLGPPGPPRLVAEDRAGDVPLSAPLRRPRFLSSEIQAILSAEAVIVSVRRPSYIPAILRQSDASRLAVLVVAPFPTQAQRDRGDDVAPLVFAEGSSADLAGAAGGSEGDLRGLSSGTTKRDGVVANIDVAPTVLAELGLPVPDEMLGSPIHVRGDAPTDLHRRYLVYQKASAPTGLTILALALLALVTGVALLFSARIPKWAAAGVAVAGPLSVAMYIAQLPASWLPTLPFPAVLVPVAAIGAAISIVAFVIGRRSPAATVAAIAGIGLVLVAADAAFGWPSRWNALEGERFYGLGNSPAGLVLAGTVLVAALLRPAAGVATLAAAALFAGLPFLGADFGGGATLAAAAALWYVLRFRRRLGVGELAIVAAAGLAGMAVLVLANKAFGVTHVTRAVEGNPLSVFVHRLGDNLSATAHDYWILPALFAIPVALSVSWRRWGPFERSLTFRPAWRDACVTLAAGAFLGFLLNDTYGTASVAFIYLAIALVLPAVADRVWPPSDTPARIGDRGPTLSSAWTR